MAKSDSKSKSQSRSDFALAASELRTVRDFFRFAISRFNTADLVYGHGTSNARDEAAFIVLEGLGLPIDDLVTFFDARLTSAERRHLASLIEARVTTRKPAAYLVGKAYIQGIPFHVDERVIVPRSFIGEILATPDLVGGEGALLVEDVESVGRVLDLCTGSGCLAILAAMAFPNAMVDAVDLSPEALEVAALNVAEHGLEDRVSLHQGDLFRPLRGARYDLILTNPPYVDAEAMALLPPEYQAEPELALAGGDDGIDLVRRIVTAAPRYLAKGGAMLCEIGTDRAALEAAYPTLDVLWVETEESSDEVFFATAAQLRAAARA